MIVSRTAMKSSVFFVAYLISKPQLEKYPFSRYFAQTTYIYMENKHFPVDMSSMRILFSRDLPCTVFFNRESSMPRLFSVGTLHAQTFLNRGIPDTQNFSVGNLHAKTFQYGVPRCLDFSSREFSVSNLFQQEGVLQYLVFQQGSSMPKIFDIKGSSMFRLFKQGILGV